jgi:hypothetical protein
MPAQRLWLRRLVPSKTLFSISDERESNFMEIEIEEKEAYAPFDAGSMTSYVRRELSSNSSEGCTL